MGPARLRPLIPPGGWTVVQQNFPDAPFDARHIAQGDFPSDMWQAEHPAKRLTLDIGCRDELDPEGVLILVLYRPDFTGVCLHHFETRDAEALVEEFARVCAAVEAGDFDEA